MFTKKMCTAQSSSLLLKITALLHRSRNCLWTFPTALPGNLCLALPWIQSTTVLLSPLNSTWRPTRLSLLLQKPSARYASGASASTSLVPVFPLASPFRHWSVPHHASVVKAPLVFPFFDIHRVHMHAPNTPDPPPRSCPPSQN